MFISEHYSATSNSLVKTGISVRKQEAMNLTCKEGDVACVFMIDAQ